MKYIKPINEIWGPVLKRDLLGETREEDKFHSKEELQEYLKSEIKKQGENVVIRNLDVSHIEDLSELFRGICLGVKTLDLSGWNTSNVKDMESMMYFCNSLISLDLSGWDTSKVKNMNGMFLRTKFNQDISKWNVSNVTNMKKMFAFSKFNQDISNWDVRNVENMELMFKEAAFSGDISNWKINERCATYDTFFNCPIKEEHKPKQLQR